MRTGGIEAGGTKFVYGIGEVNAEGVRVLDRVTVPIEPAETMIPKLISYFNNQEIEALGIASFGPLDLRRSSPTYGFVKATPKKGWSEVDFVGPFQKELQVPVGFDTDVNGAVLAEVFCGAAKGCASAVYLTVGTGIGAGIYVNGATLHGLVHPEAGHMAVRRAARDTFRGVCDFHRDEKGFSYCWEGLASGPAIEGRWGRPGRELTDRPDVWELEADYLAQGISSLILAVSPEKVILGGGVMHQASLFPLIRKKVRALIAGYIHSAAVEEEIDSYIVPPLLGDDAGLIGAFLLAANET